MNKTKVIPCIIYFYIHHKLSEKYGEEKVSVKKIKSFLFEWRFLRSIRPIIIKEMEMLGLIELSGRRNMIIKKSNFRIEDLRRYYEEVGIY